MTPAETGTITGICELIQRFIVDENSSVAHANEIELALDTRFPDDDLVQQTVEMLAMYRPEGGEFLFDTARIKQRLGETLVYLRSVS